MARGSLFDELEAKHDGATSETARADLRRKARALASKHAVDVPAWAAVKPRVWPHRDPAPAPEANHSPETIAEALAALQAWRRADHSRVLAARADGSVSLIDLSGGKSRRFANYPSARAAKAAIEQDSIAWRTQQLETGAWGRPAFTS